MAPELYALGLLTVVDLQPLAAYCDSYGIWMHAKRQFAADPIGLSRNSWLSVAKAAMRDMMTFAIQFGLTPAARSRMTIKTERPASKFGKLIA